MCEYKHVYGLHGVFLTTSAVVIIKIFIHCAPEKEKMIDYGI